MRSAVGALVLLLVATTAVGASPTVVKGGPKGTRDALARLESALAICWQVAEPARVRVRLSVAADGQVESSEQLTRGRVGQCVAGVLAVQKLRPAAKSYTVTVEFPNRQGADPRAAISKALRSDAGVRACIDGKALRGGVKLRFLVKPDGRVVDPEVLASSASDKRVGPCLARAIGRLRLGQVGLDKTMEFVMPFEFGQGSVASGGSTGGDPLLRPQKQGPISAETLSGVMTSARAQFTACYERQLAANPGLAGDVVLRYTVNSKGRTRNVKIKRTTLGNAKVERCMVQVGEQLRFPALVGRKDTRVVYPFRFSRMAK